MLFRAVVREHGDFKCLQNIITTISKNSKECSLTIRATDLLFVIRDDSKRCLPLIWAELKSGSVFAEYSFNGVSDVYDSIVLVFNPSFLARALGPVRAFESIKLKLVKIQENSYLSVDILVISPISSEKKNIVHNIPVKVILPRKWEDHVLPELPEFNTIVEMPNLKHIVDKYKNLSPYMTIFANVSSATLHLTLETDVTTLISNFMHLHVEHRGSTPGDTNDTLPNAEFSCQVETKSLALFLSSIAYPLMQKSLLINDGSCVKFRFTIKEDVNLYGIASQVSTD